MAGKPFYCRECYHSISAECRPLYRPRYLPIVGRHVHHHSADILVDTLVDTSTDTSWSLYRPRVGRYVDRHIGRHLGDMPTNTSVKCQSTCQLICRLRGAQNTHDPIFWTSRFWYLGEILLEVWSRFSASLWPPRLWDLAKISPRSQQSHQPKTCWDSRIDLSVKILQGMLTKQALFQFHNYVCLYFLIHFWCTSAKSTSFSSTEKTQAHALLVHPRLWPLCRFAVSAKTLGNAEIMIVRKVGIRYFVYLLE